MANRNHECPTAGEPEKGGLDKGWLGLLSVAGAVAGLGTLIYLVGAASLWLRFDAAGLPADVAIAHEPYSMVVALGVRGLIGIGFALLAALFLIAYVLIYLAVRRSKREELARGRRLIDVIADWATGFDGRSARQFGVCATVAIFVAALTTWQVLGAVIFLVATIGATLLYAHRRSQGLRGVPLWLVVTYALAAGVLGAAWQITSFEPVQGVIVSPQLPNQALAPGIAVPYFGEDSDHVYLGDVVLKTGATPQDSTPWTFCHRVDEVDRKNLKSLTFVGNARLGSAFKAPLVAFFALLRGRGLADHPAEDPACRKS